MLRAAVHLLQQFSAANHFIQAAEAKTGEDFAYFLGDEGHEVDDLFRGSSELGAQPLVLHTDAHRTGVAMALTHHDAAHRHERKRTDAIFQIGRTSGRESVCQYGLFSVVAGTIKK